MKIAHFFIDRPVFACVISFIILLAGSVAYFMLPVAQFPEIVPPNVIISTSYPGASAETVVNTVAIPIEEQVNGVDHMLYMSTSCSSDGSMKITVTFEVGTDPDMATVLVQNRVKIAEPGLPDEVTRQGVTVKKQSPNMVVVLSFFNPEDMKAKEEGRTLSPAEIEERSLYLSNFVSTKIKNQLARVSGVGDVTIFNSMDFSMRIWLNPDVLTARSISVREVVSALQEQNIQVAAGRIGQPPTPKGTKTNIVLTTQGRLTDEREFGDIILRRNKDGNFLRLRDIATIELGSVNYSSSSRYQGVPTSTVAIYQTPGANSLQVAENVEKALAEMRDVQKLFGNEVTYEVGYDATRYIEVSLDEVKHTLVECILIVVLIVFFFLQDWRAALIPTLTVPVSLIGCFFIMWNLDFTVNSMTLFGLILVIGIVVDDAIIVVENTQRLIDEEDMPPREAAKKAMDEVTGPIIATTFVMMSIFIPTSMVPGIVGEVYRQFALTIAGAVCISALCALTFAPALAAILLRKSVPEEKKNVLFRGFNYCFTGYAHGDQRTVRGSIASRWLVLLLWFGLLFGISTAFRHLPTGFIPNEDQGVLFVEVRMPDGSSLERTEAVVDKMQKMLDADREGIESVIFVVGYSMLDGTLSTNAAFAIMTLKPWEERYPTTFETVKSKFGIKPGKDRPDGLKETMPALFAKWNARFGSIPESSVMTFPPPPIVGLGTSGGLEFQLLDRGDNGTDEIFKAATELSQRARETGMFSVVQTTFSPFAPRFYLDIDRDKVQKMGVSLTEVFTALQGYYGSIYVNDFNRFDNVYHVTVQAQAEYRDTAQDVLNMEFKNPDGKMVPIEAIAEIKEVVGPQMLPRYQLYPTAYIQAQLADGVSTGEGMAMLDSLTQDLPGGFGGAWTGMSFQEANVGYVTYFVFALCVVFAFFVLAAQYESWTTPVIILMAVPLGIGGALLAVAIRGIDINVYTQIGFILMVGLSAKNAILITEFAIEKRRDGEAIVDAAFEAGRLRLRPIMMTSFAFILGMVPLLVASGAGAVSRHAIGTPVSGGMLTETLIGIYVTPVLFVLLTTAAERVSRREK